MNSFGAASKRIQWISVGIIIILSLGIVLLAIVWCVYFLSRVRELGRKIHYLKKQRDERCCEELTNAKVDYVKSLFIAGICLFEILSLVCGFIGIFVHNKILSEHRNASTVVVVDLIYSTYARVVVAMALSSVLVYTSLIHTLTGYLSHAYAEKRVIRLTRGDKVLLLWLLLQLIALWISIAYWRAFILFALALAIYLFPIHLCLYCKYSRRLYQLLKRRRLDAWYEFDPQPYKRLDGMCTEYRTGSILYAASIALLSATILIEFIKTFLETAFKKPEVLDLISFNITVYTQHKKIIRICFTTADTLSSVLVLFVFVFLYSLHLLIVYGVAKRLWKRRVAYKNCAKENYRPLLADN